MERVEKGTRLGQTEQMAAMEGPVPVPAAVEVLVAEAASSQVIIDCGIRDACEFEQTKNR